MDDKKLLIISGYFKGESYGLLGPQMAATIINTHSDYKAVVAGITNEDSAENVKAAIRSYFDGSPMIIGFSTLGGRPDLFDLARELRRQGAVTILAGPQAGPDYEGETGWYNHPHRFKGVSDAFSFALHGPGQQILPILSAGFDADLSQFSGVIYKDKTGCFHKNPPVSWEGKWLGNVDWQTLRLLEGKTFKPVNVSCAQVLEQIGCQHAAKTRTLEIDYPQGLFEDGQKRFARISQKGCTFCDVAVDKGYLGAVERQAVLEQLKGLPVLPDGRKIPFELINESPLNGLGKILKAADELDIGLSQINLTLRADYCLKGMDKLAQALEKAKKKNVRILLASIGFESFSDTILKNLNKGVSRQQNLDAIRAVRELKSRFPEHLGYLRQEGANHGFIHPTPWDSPQTAEAVNQTIAMYQLQRDILPNHSTPLIIHHASGLADWIRQIEIAGDVRFERAGSIIAWWQTHKKSLL